MRAATEEQAKVTAQRGRIYAQLPQTAVGAALVEAAQLLLRDV